MNLIFATNNAHKLKEVKHLLSENFRILSLNDIGFSGEIPETMPTIEGNAMQKARYIYDRFHVDCFADDTGLEVDALNGQPGVYSARYAGDGHDFNENIEKLIMELDGKLNRKACFRTVIALIYKSGQYFFEGKVCGEITFTRKGNNGFGYDPVFRPDGYNITFAEMGLALKNKISHRAIAGQKLADFLLQK